MKRRSTATRIGLLLALALAARVALVVALFDRSRPPPTFEHGDIAHHLLAGHGFSVTFLGQFGPTSQQAPLYPALLALLLRCTTDEPTALLAMQLLQAAAGALTAVLTACLAWRVWPKRRAVGWMAGACVAIWPTQIYLATHIQVACWAALLLVATAWSALSIVDRRGAARTGLLAGLLLLVEPIHALALPPLAWAVWQLAPDRSRRAGHIFTTTAVLGLILAPWLLRNLRVHGEPVFVKSTFGYAVWQGNNPTSWGTDKIPKPTVAPIAAAHDGSLRGQHAALWDARRETLYIDDVLLKPTGYREFVGLGEPARSRLLGQRATQFIRQQPWDYARLCGQRLRYFFLFDETNPKASHRVYRASTLLWLALSIVGLAWAWPDRRRVGPLVAAFAAIALFHVLTITSVRFRVALEPLSFVWGALAIVAPLERRSKSPPAARRVERLPAPSLAPRRSSATAPARI